MIQTAQPTRMRLSKEEAQASKGMVATKDRLATEAGVRMLEAGGNAVDAAVAACFAIGVVEPMSSGIGGGGYLNYQVDGQGGVVGFPMRGPLAAKPDLYKLTGEAYVGNFGWAGVENDANLEGYLSIAVPGAVAGLCEAHRRFGRLPLSEVVAPAASIARDGFTPNWYLLFSLGRSAGKLFKYPELRSVFMPGDNMLPSGDMGDDVRLRQPDLAEVLTAIGRNGPDAFYRGEVAQAIVSDVRANGGILSEEDLAQYKPFVWEGGLEIDYRGLTVRVPPFACAGSTSAMTLNLFAGFDAAASGHNSADTLHAYISSARLAYADRFEYFGDPAFVDTPWKGLLSDAYADRRRAEIGDRALAAYKPGDPWQEEGRAPKEKLPSSLPAFDSGTTHLCAMDKDGNAVSLTNTLMAGFGSGIVAKGTGVVMNDGMMWFDPLPGRVNSIMPGKFPLNNMTPALVLDGSGVRLAVGASGGRRITNCVTQLISKVMDFGMGPQEAIDSPRVDCSMPATSVDPRLDPEVIAALEARGHRVSISGDGFMESGFSSFASPAAITLNGRDDFRAGVDTFHSAYAAGPE